MIEVKKILEELCYENYYGNTDFYVDGVASFDSSKQEKIIFIKKFDESFLEKLNKFNRCIVLLDVRYKEYITNMTSCFIFVNNPRYEYARCTSYFIDCICKKREKILNVDMYSISESAKVNEGTIIEPYVYIGHNVSIGKNCLIMTGAKIRENVSIGDNCIIRENCVIGGYGFGFEKDKNGKNFRIPHLGGVIIEDNVEIGALTTVCSGTINPTIIKEYSKIDDHVHIAHNCHIGANCTITACAEVSGSVNIGDNTWLAPNTSIKNGLVIGKNVIVGMGAVVNNNVESDSIVVGPIAENLEEAKKFFKVKKALLKKEEI